MVNYSENGITTKQKIMGAIVIIFFLIIIWQIYDLFFKTPAPPAPANIQPKTSASMSPQGATQLTSTPPTVSPSNPSSPNQNVGIVTTNAISSTDSMTQKMLEAQERNQIQYLASINKLQNLKVERDIAETNQAIAAAKLATATTEEKMSGLLTNSTSSVVSIHESEPVNTDTNKTRGEEKEVKSLSGPSDGRYSLLSVSKQLGKWHAIINYQGKLYDVSLGDKLPGTHAIVRNIQATGITIEEDHEKHTIQMINSF